MKVSPFFADFLAQNRHKYLNELALYLDMPVHLAINKAVSMYKETPSTLEGVVIPQSFSQVTPAKVELIAEGKNSCRAYLAQVALDICLQEGYCPSSDEDLRLLACMLLVRFTVLTPEDAFKLIPEGWTVAQADQLKNAILQVNRDV